MEMLELSPSARTAEVMKRCVLFREYEASWPQLYEAEIHLVLGQIGEHLLAIEHIGSTSVPGLSAKPIIDMLLGVETPTSCATRWEEPLKRQREEARASVSQNPSSLLPMKMR